MSLAGVYGMEYLRTIQSASQRSIFKGANEAAMRKAVLLGLMKTAKTISACSMVCQGKEVNDLFCLPKCGHIPIIRPSVYLQTDYFPFSRTIGRSLTAHSDHNMCMKHGLKTVARKCLPDNFFSLVQSRQNKNKKL